MDLISHNLFYDKYNSCRDTMVPLKKVCARLYGAYAAQLKKPNLFIAETTFNKLINQLLKNEGKIKYKEQREIFKYCCLLVIIIRYTLLKNKVYSYYNDDDYKTCFDLNFEQLMRLFYNKYIHKTLNKIILLPNYEAKIFGYGNSISYSITGTNDCVVSSFKHKSKKYDDIHAVFDTHGKIVTIFVGKLQMKKVRRTLRKLKYTDFVENPRGKHYYYSFVLSTCPINNRDIISKLSFDLLALREYRQDSFANFADQCTFASKKDLEIAKFFNGVGIYSADYDCIDENCRCPRPINGPTDFQIEINDCLYDRSTYDKYDYMACLKNAQKVEDYRRYISYRNPALFSLFH